MPDVYSQNSLPADDAIVAAILASNNVVFGVPNKTEIFRLAAENPRNEKLTRVRTPNRWLRLRIVKVIGSSFEVTHPPDLDPMGTNIDELNYAIRAQVLCTEMALTRIRVIYVSRTDISRNIVFEADEYPGAHHLHLFRTVRVTVDENGRATYEAVTSTTVLENLDD